MDADKQYVVDIGKNRREKTYMKQIRIVWILSFLITASVAFAKITVDWDKQASFTNYKTYAWGKGTPAKNPLMDQRIIDAIDKELSAKGFQKVDADKNPDLIVLYHGAVGTQTELNTMNTGGWGWRWGGGMSTTTVDQIPVGQLSVDIRGCKNQEIALAWQCQ
jgi:hypothetical protein